MSFELDSLNVVCAILIITTSLPFILFVSAGTWHFTGGSGAGIGGLSILSLIGFIGTQVNIWMQPQAAVSTIIGVTLQVVALFLFGWCVGASGRKNLGRALNDKTSKQLIVNGPYSVTRHPFYSTYIVYWIGCAVIAGSTLVTLIVGSLIGIYIYVARQEDGWLCQNFPDQFPAWYSNTGAFFPRWRRLKATD